MVVLSCHLPSQLSLEMTEEQIPTSATSVGVSGKLLCCLSPLPPSVGHSTLAALWAGSVSHQSPLPLARECRQLVSSRAEFLSSTRGRGFRSGHGDKSQAPADVTFVCVLGLQGPFRTGLCAVPLACHMETGS